jgi:Protein kinase domain
MVMEYAAGGSLYSILSGAELRAKLSPNSRLYVAHALISALEYLHSHHVFHRDVKPENICFWDDWESNPKMVLIDFGIASRVAERMSGILLSKLPGTIPYMADECLRIPQQFTEKSEVFACGVVFLNLLTGTCYWSFDHRAAGEDEILAHLDKSAGPWLAKTDEALAALACTCLLKNPNARPTISYVLAELERLRQLACAEEFVKASIQKHVQSHNRQSRPSIIPLPHGESLCVVCGKCRLKGVLCENHHFTCSAGSCLEEVVREQLGEPSFMCPSPACTKHFVLVDVYGKISGDLYSHAVLAASCAERNCRYAAGLADKIVQDVWKALSNELRVLEGKVKGAIESDVSDIITRSLVVFRDQELEMSSINAHVSSLLAISDENSKNQNHWETELRDLLNKESVLEGRNDDEAKNLKDAIHLLSSKIDKLSLSHADGVSWLASGRLRCPRLCLLWPFRSRRGVRNKLSIAKEYQLVFLCAHDRSPIKTSVSIKDPKKWLRKAAPLVKFCLFSLRVLAAVNGGIPVPSLPDSIAGNSLQERVDVVLQEMTLLLEAEDIQTLEKWLTGVADRRDLLAAIACREGEIPEEAFGALAEEAYQPKNRGWMDEMEIAQKDGCCFAWVKKANAHAWRSSEV